MPRPGIEGGAPCGRDRLSGGENSVHDSGPWFRPLAPAEVPAQELGLANCPIRKKPAALARDARADCAPHIGWRDRNSKRALLVPITLPRAARGAPGLRPTALR